MKNRSRIILFPLLIWTVLFVFLPMAYIVVLSFSSGFAHKLTYVFTLDNYRQLFSKNTLGTLLDTLRISGLTTLFCALIGYPFAYFMAQASPRVKGFLMMLVIIPFWTSALMRMFGWRIIFQTNGLLNDALSDIHNFFYGLLEKLKLVEAIPKYKKLKLLNTEGLVIFGMTYTMLPFMILPMYSSIDQLPPSAKEAARDLGAGPIITFLTVSLPLSLPGVISGCVLVFVPSMGLFFVNSLLGGAKKQYLGDLINFFLHDGQNWTLGCALSLILVALTFVSMAVYRRYSGGASVGVY